MARRRAAAPGSVPTDSITQRVWGLEYIDELIYFHTDSPVTSGGEGGGGGGSEEEGEGQPESTTPADGDFANAKGYYALVDRLYSVIGVARASDGWVEERVRYTPYGVGRVFRNSDVNRDGVVNFSDQNMVQSFFGSSMLTGGASYDPDLDVDLSGVIDFADLNAVLGDFGLTSPAEGQTSLQSIANTVGYAGYIFDPATELYCVRFRWHASGLGHWLSRDPSEYAGGEQLYRYAHSRPTYYTDYTGLVPDDNLDKELPNLRSPPPPPRPFPTAADPRNDMLQGCGIRIHRATKNLFKSNWGHEWIELDDPDLNPSKQGIGFWPAGNDKWEAPSKLYTPAGQGGNNCTPEHRDDPYTNIRPTDKEWYVQPDMQLNHPSPQYPVVDGTPMSQLDCSKIRDCIRRQLPDRLYCVRHFNCRDAVDWRLAQCGLRRFVRHH